MANLDHKVLARFAIGMRFRLSFIPSRQISKTWPDLDENECKRLLSLAAAVDRATMLRLASKVALLCGFFLLIQFLSDYVGVQIFLIGYKHSFFSESAILEIMEWTGRVILVLMGMVLLLRWPIMIESAESDGMRAAVVVRPGDAELIAKIESKSNWKNPGFWLLLVAVLSFVAYLPTSFPFPDLSNWLPNWLSAWLPFLFLMALFLAIIFFRSWRWPKPGKK